MSDQESTIQSGENRRAGQVGWFLAGALSVVALLGMLALAGPYLDSLGTTEIAETPPVIIEGY